MSPKFPIRGIVTVDVHPRPSEPPGVPLPHRFGPPDATPTRVGYSPQKTMAGADLNAINPAPSVMISDTPLAVSQAPARNLSLEHYRIDEQIQLPAPDAEGLRIFKGRRYVDVPDGGVVHVVTDPQTGLYRARLPSERMPSGPTLLRDPKDLLWHPLKAFEPFTFALSATRLQAFATELDFSTARAGQDHVHRYANKLYVVIENRAYQVLHDLDASSPALTVMRIVRPADPVAADPDNVYVATRPGRSEPIAFDVLDGWMGTLVGGAGGMRRNAKPTEAARAADLIFELQALDLEFDQAMTKGEQLQNRWRALKGTDGEPNVLEQLERHHQRELSILEKTLSVHTEQRERIVAARGGTAYRDKVIMLQKGRLLTLNQLMIANDSRQLLDGPIFGGPVSEHPKVAAHLSSKLVILKQRQAIADELQNKWRLSQSELSGAAFEPMDLHDTVAFWVYAKSRMFVDTEAEVDVNNAHARYLGFCFGEVTFAFRAFDSIPAQARIALLSDLLDQTSAIRVSYENLQLPSGAHHSRSREEIVEAIRTFEGTLEEHLNRFHHEQEKTSTLPPHEQPIDFDFIPAQDRNQPSATPRKMFRSKHHGVYKIRVGRPRRTDAGEELIDVINPHDPAEVLQTYERREGEWRRQIARQEKNLATLTTQAEQLLQKTDVHLNTAWRDENAKRNATSIVEFLSDRADDLTEVSRQIEQAPNPGAVDTATLLQRLGNDSQRLLNESEEIRVRLYKDPAYLSIDRVAYLISHGHLSATRTHSRVQLGKGNKKDFLDVYTLNDRQTGTTLWHAHFHYADKDSPALNFTAKGGHLKTLQQSRLGTASQRRDEQAGRAHVRIWREDIDLSTAQQIFQLAS
ncbi:hypothetical protein NZ35_08110 [Pseudomonas chlororaphis]|uniref:Uncharacterized protein n=1 Tax=Pseudomonas chlororaphis TaxID=587753 RepID=A0A0A6DFU3_9PSED|nr:hypothetical protein NZ35_08110 [Pseudomonas chlororaphis]